MLNHNKDENLCHYYMKDKQFYVYFAKRDINKRERTIESVVNQYLTTVRPMHEKYVEPSKVHADLFIKESISTKQAVNLTLSRIQILQKKPSLILLVASPKFRAPHTNGTL